MRRAVVLSRTNDIATDKAVGKLQSQLDHKELLDGAVLLRGIELRDGEVDRIPHRLGRPVTGYSIARCHSEPAAAFVLYDENDGHTDIGRWLYIGAKGAAVTVDLVVF